MDRFGEKTISINQETMELIAEIFLCSLEDINHVRLLKEGMTNRSFSFSINDQKYIIRVPGEGTEKLINRFEEAQVFQAIKGLELCDDPVYIDPKRGYKITRFIENVRPCDPRNEEDLRRCMKKLKRFHDMELAVSHRFDIFQKIDFYESLWGKNESIYPDYKETKRTVLGLKRFIEQHRGKMQLTHIDAVPDNFLFDPDTEGELSLQLTDWEYAAMQDKHVDIAMFCIYSLYNRDEIDRLIDIYFDGRCDATIRTKIYCYVAACGLLWSNWCEYKRQLGVQFGQYSERQFRYAKEYSVIASEMIAEIEDRS